MSRYRFLQSLCLACLVAASLSGCGRNESASYSSLDQLKDREFGVPTGSVADKLVTSRFPDARFQYYNSVLDSAIAVQQGKVDAAAYDEPILKNLAAKNKGLAVLPGMITTDNYGFAVRLEDKQLKAAIDDEVKSLKSSGQFAAMKDRWLPERGAPAPMPEIEAGSNGVLRFGTAAITEPFSFVDASQQVVGLDVEIAKLVAKRLNKKLVVVNMDFGAMIPALIANKVDMIGACITITEERAKKVLFSEPYYTGGIAALVRSDR